MTNPEQYETLSAFLDAEQSERETSQIVDALLKDPDYKARFIRSQLVSDAIQDQVHSAVLKHNVLKSVSARIDQLPAYHVNETELHKPVIEDVTRSGLFKTIMGHKLVSGLSVAASVMLVTLFTLQQFNTDTPNSGFDNAGYASNDSANSSAAKTYTPSLIQAPAQLPATLASGAGASGSGLSSSQLKQQYQWVEADPELARQVRQYLNDHELHRAAYTLQPQIREASYQINE